MKRENGLVFASYLIWGLLPLFWKQLSMVNSAYVLASRIIWSAIFCGSLLLLRRRWNSVKIALADKGEVGLIFLCAILISINWGLYIFSIAIGKVLESSLAYYMSPIISVLIGALFFREKHGLVQWLAITIAAVGVLIAVVMYGSVPWLALTIGGSFAVYGALKKKVNADGETSIFLETLFMAPFALAFLNLCRAAWQRRHGSFARLAVCPAAPDRCGHIGAPDALCPGHQRDFHHPLRHFNVYQPHHGALAGGFLVRRGIYPHQSDRFRICLGGSAPLCGGQPGTASPDGKEVGGTGGTLTFPMV